MGVPKVSVIMVTYHHEPYIKKSIEGVLMQRCDFEYELIIANDRSPDNTDEIVKNYLAAHPNKSRVNYILNERNMGMMPNFISAIGQAKGEYIALCEGDDYWIDDLKLQKQVDFMEANPDCSLCFHPTKIVYNNSTKPDKVVGVHTKTKFKLEELIVSSLGMWTVSLLFRKNVLDNIPDWYAKIKLGDGALKFLAGTKGDFGYIGNEPMAIYNRGGENAWSNGEGVSKKWEENRYYDHVEVLDYFNEYSNHKYEKYITIKKKKFLFKYLRSAYKLYTKRELFKIMMQHKKSLLDVRDLRVFIIWFNFFFK